MHKKYQTSGLNTTFSYSDLSFCEYIEHMRNVISRTRTDLEDERRDHIIDCNSPFELWPDNHDKNTPIDNGILLVHGLLDSPYGLRDIAQHFQQRGYLVRAILLPGHGTVPGDLLKVCVDDWLQAVEYGIRSFAGIAKHTYIFGFSGGASLALYHALQGAAIKGLFLIAPSIKLRAKSVGMAKFLKLTGYIKPEYRWFIRAEEQDYSKYESIPYNLAHQAHRLTQVIQQQIKRAFLYTPVYMAISADDETISATAAEKFFKKALTPHKHLLIYSKEKKHSTDPDTEYRNSCHPEAGIVDYSHVCIQISPDNPHYGIDGDYQIEPLYKGKKKINSMVRGAVSKANIRKYATTRLSYNPDFNYFLQSVDDFLEHTRRLSCDVK